MSAMRSLQKLLFGETWLLPGGLAVVLVVATFAAKPLLGDAWASAGGYVLLAGVLGVLWLAVRTGAGPASGRRGRDRNAG